MSQQHHFAYYCSGHGYGHCTRVTALTIALLEEGHLVDIITNAPSHVFTAALEWQPSASRREPHSKRPRATYRHALIDAGISQPKAYDVDRLATIKGLAQFMASRPAMIEAETAFLKANTIDCVLVDAPFLPCAAAKCAGIPAAIISNFTFCTCYSYLSLRDQAPRMLRPFAVSPTTQSSSVASRRARSAPDGLPTLDDFSSISQDPSAPLPAELLAPLVEQVIADYANASLLLRLPGAIPIPAFDGDARLPSTAWVDLNKGSFTTAILDVIGLPDSVRNVRTPKRQRFDMPLIVRPAKASIYDASERTRLLTSIGIPTHLQDPQTTKILLVSFGGQKIPNPKSRPPSPISPGSPLPLAVLSDAVPSQVACQVSRPLATPDHLYVPGAPPALTHPSPVRHTISLAMPDPHDDGSYPSDVSNECGLLPPGWIAILCGYDNSSGELLPPNFYTTGKDVYVPDLTATADVILGKLGYGTCSEAVATQTPFIYVPRPLFIEEYGLKRLMEQQGKPVEMSRDAFESGQWEHLIMRAYRLGCETKAAFREGRALPPDHSAAARTIVASLISWLNA
ncbi:uncharacterized protein L969DRAFT_92945 [Mixia osmundae IAM 14324]|uniref:Glycosyl transferase family 28 C-terminal domain-containing protein n=1 Tax=Mixia osmundae (strain CBS 9802 / IAM 14324 / JCM 22182 / KY 12970) TaxID=764103 RepID=G7DTU9_MIXOS|nr:uncharacterized protein L969DRAFT_92945 [Mixia osmundae IAM 14324]KEI41723.1 hypothetical protein L969DRAFT_92945 [Mixia osmundae IAM 14324]GAA94009.1 hypothetical protein E5Q_00656 [Mixia osmundae IAM 14324]